MKVLALMDERKIPANGALYALLGERCDVTTVALPQKRLWWALRKAA